MYSYCENAVELDGTKRFPVQPGSGSRFEEFDGSRHNFYLIYELGSKVLHADMKTEC